MTITHHPSDDTLTAYAAGSLDQARSLVVATHLSLCPQCRERAAGFESVGGALLERAEPAAMRPDALKRALARIGEAAQDSRPGTLNDEGFPQPLPQYALGPWRWAGRRVQWRSVDTKTDDIKVFMLRAEPGTRLPDHRHTGIEWTCVFQGAFRHQGGRYGPGDFDEADESMEHKPTVEEGVACICLVALQGEIRLQGLIGKLLQPLIRF